MPITDLPGMTSTTLTLTRASDRAKSLARPVILLAFIPAAGWISKQVTTGPRKDLNNFSTNAGNLEVSVPKVLTWLQEILFE